MMVDDIPDVLLHKGLVGKEKEGRHVVHSPQQYL